MSGCTLGEIVGCTSQEWMYVKWLYAAFKSGLHVSKWLYLSDCTQGVRVEFTLGVRAGCKGGVPEWVYLYSGCTSQVGVRWPKWVCQSMSECGREWCVRVVCQSGPEKQKTVFELLSTCSVTLWTGYMLGVLARGMGLIVFIGCVDRVD